MTNTLFLRLDAPLQSWGEDSQWSERRTAPEPTKSGVVGLLACALGWDDDGRIGSLSRQITVGVRCDFPGTPSPLIDYHTVGGGFERPQLLTGTGAPKISSGKPHTEPTQRYYLCDASFLVAVRADADTIASLARAVESPVWPIFLGRKCCVPSRPPFDGMGEFATVEQALKEHPVRILERERIPDSRPRFVIEIDPRQGEVILMHAGRVRRRDNIASRALRLFEPRNVRELLGDYVSIEYLDEGGN
jgi:CRISPR system Cascade subunit CasD